MSAAHPPQPGRPVRGSDTGRPIMASFDLLGRRWTLRIVCELSKEPLGFSELRRRASNMSKSVLSLRLHELVEAKVVHRDEASSAYSLTPLGKSLYLALEPLFTWSNEWAAALGADPDDSHHSEPA
ncbi:MULTISPECIES: winged helix-turn-helix transcriptional regulator [Gordonia]|uniref:winged helix-turn-helix transcriptional regulator n=1 Tax=Gordonia TaxID=2053 RepID=UPI001F2A08B6|nr:MULTISPECIES: helix-turn-helix domain-containing protein [Gordonia]UPW12264.1 helix-turn-helix transcriptional regulator [Gordonia amicalis]